MIKKDEKVGIANNEGNIILDTEYLEISILGKDNKSGFIIKTTDGKYGIIDYSKNQVLEPKYEEVKKVFGNDLYTVVEGGKEKIINKQGEEIGAKDFDRVAQILKTKDSGIIFVKGEKYGVMNLNGEIIIRSRVWKFKRS